MMEYHKQIIDMAVRNEHGSRVDFLAIEYPVTSHESDSRTFATGAVIQLVSDWMAPQGERVWYCIQFGYDTPILSVQTRTELIELVHAYLFRMYTDGGALRIFIC